MKALLAALALFPAAAFAQSPDAPPASEPAASAFESPALLPSSQFVPEDRMSGPLHRVSAQTWNDGLRNTYNLATDDDQVQEVTTTPALLNHIAEIYAIAELENQSQSEEFAKSLAAAGKGTVDSAIGVVTDPVGTIRRIPQGASRFFGRIGEGLKNVADGGDAGGGKILKSVSGIDTAKAQLAMKLGVSPYTQNQELQKLLGDSALAIAGGGLVFKAGTMAVGSVALSVLGVNNTLQQTLATSTAADLAMRNTKALLALGASREDVDAFLLHSWYNPWVATITVDALSQIGANPTEFLQAACEAQTPEDAFYHQRLAQILATYHRTATPLKSLPATAGAPYGIDADGTLVLPVSLDYAIWDARTAARADQFEERVKGSDTMKALAVWADGQFSPRLQQELSQRQIGWQMEVLQSDNP